MRSFYNFGRCFLAIFAGAGLLLHYAAGQTPVPYRISFTQGKAACQIVRFPEVWITEPLEKMDSAEMAELLKWVYSESAVFRRSPDMDSGTSLVSVEALGDRKSPHKFLLNLDASPIIQRSGDSAWNSSIPVYLERFLWGKLANQGLTIEPVGNENNPSAVDMTEVFSTQSPDRKWAAVFRWHGRLARGATGVPSKRLAPGSGPSATDYSVEIADAMTERKTVAASGQFNGVSTMYVTDSLGWVTNRIFWMPLDNDTRDVFVCDSARFGK